MVLGDLILKKNAEEGGIFRFLSHIGAQPAYNRLGKEYIKFSFGLILYMLFKIFIFL